MIDHDSLIRIFYIVYGGWGDVDLLFKWCVI